jgi:hypothetical protein
MFEMEISTQAAQRLRMAALRVKSALAAADVKAAGARVLALLGKANFDPNQPRVPSGNPEGDQWTRVEAWRSGRSRTQLASIVGIPRWLLRDLISRNPPPEIPDDEPPRVSLRWPVIKEVAGWMLMLGLRETPAGPVLALIEAAKWAYDYSPYVSAFLDEPKSLQELQRAVIERKRGYDIQHIVEKTPALADGFTRAQTEAPENLALVPTLKHWRLTAWFATKNDDFGGVSPREYLRGKSWDERKRLGLSALIKEGILKP